MGEGSFDPQAGAKRPPNERDPGREVPPAASARPVSVAGPEVVPEPQSLLSAVVRGLRVATDCPAVAWARRADGSPYVAAAEYAGAPPAAPDAAEFEAAKALPGAANLHGEGVPPELRRLAQRHACSAAAPVVEAGGSPLAVLLLGNPVGSGAAPRPRTLAALDSAARRLASPLATALRLERLAELDAEVRQLDRLAVLGTLATEIAHEVRNPLSSVKTFLQLLPERRDDPEFLGRSFRVVSDELRRMERLLDLLIDHGQPRKESAAGASTPVGETLDAVAALLGHRATTAGVRFETEVDPKVPDVALARDGLRQVVLNLALNAVTATPPGGAVRVCGRAHEGGLLLVVSDEGPGVPAELRNALFEPFASKRRDRPGGLGLAITRRIVEEAGGTIAVFDRRGGGSEFRVSLPAARANRRPPG